MSAMLYSVLSLYGFYSLDDIKTFRQWGSPTPGHPERDLARGVENTSGPLGQGHTMAVGAAIAERFLAARFGETGAHKIYTFISDGGVQEEISQGAGRLAGHLGLHNLIMFYDSNDIQLSSKTADVSSEDTQMKYEAWGWRVETINGNDTADIRKALKKAAAETEKPTLIIGKTVMGKGALKENGESFEREVETHGMPLGKAGCSFKKTVAHLGGDPENPFQIFPDVAAYYGKLKKEKIDQAREQKIEFSKWEIQNKKLAEKLKRFWAGELPEMDYGTIEQKPGIATRAASRNVLAEFARKAENMVVSSADLSNSDNTDGFLKSSKIFRKGDFSGAFLQAGVSELTMAAIMNGMALHGGIIPVCGTFFVFSDYMKPAIRLAALMELPVKYVLTHDAFRVGEDGPTHQPVEQEAQIRLLEKMKNLEGNRSILVLRPADAAETAVAWKMAMENTKGPTALLLSRQPIPEIRPVLAGHSRYTEALQAEKGAYIAVPADGKPDLILIANGSEVATVIAGADILRKDKGLKVQVVSAISEGLFREQTPAYQEKVLPAGIPVLGLTAGLPVTLQGLTGPFGKVIGLSRFGASAPFQVLDEKFGYTPANVVKQTDIYLKEFKENVKKWTAGGG
jgi:transketolase